MCNYGDLYSALYSTWHYLPQHHHGDLAKRLHGDCRVHHLNVTPTNTHPHAHTTHPHAHTHNTTHTHSLPPTLFLSSVSFVWYLKNRPVTSPPPHRHSN